MNVPPATNPTWVELVTGRRKHEFGFLAAKMLVTRIRLSISKDPSPGNVASAARELHALYAANASLPSVQQDLAKAFS